MAGSAPSATRSWSFAMAAFLVVLPALVGLYSWAA
jgi:hypothetical protein